MERLNIHCRYQRCTTKLAWNVMFYMVRLQTVQRHLWHLCMHMDGGGRQIILFFFFSSSFYLFIYLFYFTVLYWFCHTLTWICHGCTCVLHPEPPFHLPPHPIPLGHPVHQPWASCTMHWTWTGDWFHIW